MVPWPPVLLAEGLPDDHVALTACCSLRIHSSVAGSAGAALRRNLVKHMGSVSVMEESATSEVFSMEAAPVHHSEETQHEGKEMIRVERKVARRTAKGAVVVAADVDSLFAPS